MIALLGNLAWDVVDGGPRRPGGAPYHAVRALRHLDERALVYARCAGADRAELLPALAPFGTPVHSVDGERTAGFEIDYEGDRRRMAISSLGDTWLPADVPRLGREVRWVHVAPLARTDFPAETLAAAARGRRLSLDGQGLVRRGEVGPLRLDADFDPELLRHVWVLKLSDEEAEVIGDPLALPVRELLLTHGARGATVYADGRADQVAAFALAGDPTGAGDAFCVAYLGARSRGNAPAAAARRATAAVASLLAA